jgi:hypothetical protein
MSTVAARPVSGTAHVATVSFLASRAAPAGGFWIALAGGLALARAAQRSGARQGYGGSIAAMLETVAIMGPSRFGVPLTQAATAPLLGRLEARGAAPALQWSLCAAIRLAHNTATTAFAIWVILGGLDAYTGTWTSLAGRVGLEVGTGGALAVTAAALLLWAAFASAVQVAVYRRGLVAWPDDEAGGAGASAPAAGATASVPRFDPRAVAAAAAVAFALLLASTAWLLLGAVVVWLGGAWAISRPDREAVPTGLVLTAVLAGGALAFGLGAGLGAEVALRRALRAALLVLVATWLRAAAGAPGLREVFRRVLGRLRRVPAVPEAAGVLDGIGSEGRLLEAGRQLATSLRDVPRRPMAILDGVLGWVARESARFRVGSPDPAPALRVGAADWALVVLAAAPAAALVVG